MAQSSPFRTLNILKILLTAIFFLLSEFLPGSRQEIFFYISFCWRYFTWGMKKWSHIFSISYPRQHQSCTWFCLLFELQKVQNLECLSTAKRLVFFSSNEAIVEMSLCLLICVQAKKVSVKSSLNDNGRLALEISNESYEILNISELTILKFNYRVRQITFFFGKYFKKTTEYFLNTYSDSFNVCEVSFETYIRFFFYSECYVSSHC